MMNTNFVLLTTVVFGILVLDIEQANGIKCYHCAPSCGSDNGKEIDCDLATRTTGANNEFQQPILNALEVNQKESGLAAATPSKYDLCVKLEQEDGRIERTCSYKAKQKEFNKIGFKCNEFPENFVTKACFCSTDLCNEAPKVIGNAKPLAFLGVVAFISTYSIANLFF